MKAFIFSQYHSMEFHSMFQKSLLIIQIILIPELIMNLLLHFRNLYFATKNKSLIVFSVLNSQYIYSLDDIYSESLHYSFVLCWITLACKYLPGKGDNTASKLNNFIPVIKSVKELVFVHWLVNITLFMQKKTEVWTLLIAGDLCLEKPPVLWGNIW